MRRCLALTALVLLLAAPAALGQSGSSPFGPLPQAAPAPTATPTPASTSQDPISRTTLLLIAAGVAAVFVGLGIAVTRDARKNLTEHDREALEREPGAGRPTAKQRDAAKVKARQKAKAARAARKRTTRNR